MSTPLFTGCAAALVTPFCRDGSLDESALLKLIDMQLEANMDALVLLGTTGEPCSLSMKERERIIALGVHQVNGRIPVIVGTGSNSTRAAIEYAHQAEDLGASGQLSVTPYYNKTTQDGLVRHYHAILESCQLPMILYNVPSRTGMNCTAATVRRLSAHPLIAGIKEASGSLPLAEEMQEAAGQHFPLYCGNDDLILPLMAQGAIGAISVVANMLPMQTRAITSACLQGCFDEARCAQQALMPLIRALFSQVSPIPIKAALAAMGIIEDVLRLPLTPMDEPYRAQLMDILRCMNLINA